MKCSFILLLLAALTSVESAVDITEQNNITTLPFLLECRIPEDTSFADNINTTHVNLTEEEMNQLLIEGPCFLACLSDGRINSDQVGVKNYSLSNYWPYVDINQIDCGNSGNIHECTRACIYDLSTSSTPVVCANECVTICNLGCDGVTTQCHPWIHSGCSIACPNANFRDPNNACLVGCKLDLPILGSQVPLDPITHPSLIPIRDSDSIGQFGVDLSSAVPQSTAENQTDFPTVAFLFRFEVVDTQHVFFNWTTNPFTNLDLADYACQDLLVSFAVGNVNGLSNFSLPTQITVHGDERLIPNAPVNISVNEEFDTRIGFFGHVILNVSWDGPSNDAYLDNYTINVRTDVGENITKCGSELWQRIVTCDVTTVSIEALSPYALPTISCRYLIQIHSFGPDGKSLPLEDTHDIQTTFDPNYISFDCHSLWQPPEFSLNLTWMLPPFLRRGNIISNFVVDHKFTDGVNIVTVPIDRVTIQFPQDVPVTYSKILNSSAHSSNTSYYIPQASTSLNSFLLQTYVTWNAAIIPYVPPRHVYTCTANAVPPPPSHVETFTVIPSFMNDFELNLYLEWSPPSIANGELMSYDICIGSVPLEPDQDIPNGGDHECSTVQLLESTNITEYFPPNRYPLYVQIRANNIYVSGNWNQAVVIPVNSFTNTSIDATDVSTTAAVVITIGLSTQMSMVGVLLGSTLGSIVAAVLLVLCISMIICYIRMLRKRKRLWRITQGTCDPMFNAQRNVLFDKPSSTSLPVPQLDDWEIPANEVIMEKLLGEGAFGEVYKGIVKCPIVNPKIPSSAKNAICTPVAIKLLKLSAMGNERQDFLAEIEMMKKVAEGQNPHVVCLLGCVTIQEPLCLITEFVKYGDLLSYLRTNRRMISGFVDSEGDDSYIDLGNVAPMDLISFAYQIASGMEYLSSLGIVHRDLACRNILVDEGKVLKITDFGMSRETDEIYVQKRTGRVPLKWMAIESIIAREFTSASDVWSYGITLWEIGTLGGFPYPSVQNDELLSLLKKGYRMEKPDNCSVDVYNIMQTCWDEQPSKRPTFTTLRSKFDTMLLADKKDEYIDLRIDNNKSYYQEFFHIGNKGSACGSDLSMDADNDSAHASNKGSLKSTENATDFLTYRKLHTASSADRVDSKKGQHMEHGTITPNNETQFHGNSRTYVNTGRPVSMYLSTDRNESGNPYVDEPSSVAASSLTLPCTKRWGEATNWSSEGAIEMNEFDFSERRKKLDQKCPEIQITTAEDYH